MIKVKVDELDADLNTLNSDIGDFKPYSEDFNKSVIEGLSGSSSDFISKIDRALESMAHSKAPELLKKVQEYHDDVKTLSKTFRQKDEELSKSMQINK